MEEALPVRFFPVTKFKNPQNERCFSGWIIAEIFSIASSSSLSCARYER
jgi:hypothetical protein